jgi:hypothetical protein
MENLAARPFDVERKVTPLYKYDLWLLLFSDEQTRKSHDCVDLTSDGHGLLYLMKNDRQSYDMLLQFRLTDQTVVHCVYWSVPRCSQEERPQVAHAISSVEMQSSQPRTLLTPSSTNHYSRSAIAGNHFLNMYP